MYGMNFSGTKLSDDPNDAAAFFKRTQYIKRVYERKFYWYPIYQDQIDKDPTLVQAPFWDKVRMYKKLFVMLKRGKTAPLYCLSQEHQ